MQIYISELVSKVQKGDRDAFSKLYQLTFKDSYYLALKIAGSEVETAEIVEESYKKVFSSIHNLKNSENIEAWIKHITAIKCVEFLKLKKKIDFSSEPSLDYSKTIEEGLEFLPKDFEKSETAIKTVNKIFDGFSDRKKVITLLYYYNEMPVAYIAKTLGCTENNVNKELGSARAEIKGCFDQETEKETPLSPLHGTPVLASLLHSAKQQQMVEVDLLRSIFASATEGMFDITEKLQSETSPVCEPVNKEIKKVDPHIKKKEKGKIFNKINSLTKKQKTASLICIGAFIILIIAGGFLINYISESENSEEIAEVDSEMIKQIEPFQEVYDKILQECYSYEGDNWKESQFTFAYVDDNEIPDMIFMLHEADEDLGIIYMNGNDKDHEDNMMVELSHTWFGEDGSMAILEEYVGEYYYKEIYRTYEEYKYVDGEKTVVKRLRYQFDEDSEGIEETWTYSENNELKELNSMTEFNKYVKEMLGNYKKVVAGYSVKDYVESGKTLTQYIKKAEALVYDYLTVVELLPDDETETTDAPEKIDYIWQESTVLNSYESIKFYSEDTCVIKMKENGMYGLVDSKGNVVVQPEYEYGFDWCSYGPGTVHYIVNVSKDESRLIDLDNGYVVEDSCHDGHGYDLDEMPSGFQNIDTYSNGIAAAQKNGKWGYVDKNLQTVIPFGYERVETNQMLNGCRLYDGKYIPVKKNGKMGIINKENEVIVPFEYSVIMQGKDGIFIAQKDGKWGFIGIAVTPKEPGKAKMMAKTPEWEKNYTKLLKEEYEMNYSATLKDVDKNGIPDLIVYDRSAQTDFVYMYMNGKMEDEFDQITFGGTSLYENNKGEYAVYRLYHSGQDMSESYSSIELGQQYAEAPCNGVSYIKQGNYVETPSETWYRDQNAYVSDEITKEEYDAYVKKFEKEYKQLDEFYVSDFIESGDALSKYIK